MQATPPPNLFRTLLVLGRVSNLPTVWSNCLAAWLLNFGAAWNNFYVLLAGTTMLYVGGMYLNDAFDVEVRLGGQEVVDADDQGRHEVREGPDEDQERPGEVPGRRQRQRDGPEPPPAPTPRR